MLKPTTYEGYATSIYFSRTEGENFCTKPYLFSIYEWSIYKLLEQNVRNFHCHIFLGDNKRNVTAGTVIKKLHYTKKTHKEHKRFQLRIKDLV